MVSAAQDFYELRFKLRFLEASGAAFQDLFVSVMSKAYPGDFIACRPWGQSGDRKNDGYLKSQRILFQIYAPLKMRERETQRKITVDFNEALPHWQEHFDTWIFVTNSRDGLPPAVLEKLLALERDNSPVKIRHWGLSEILLQLHRLSPEALSSLFGPPPNAKSEATPTTREKARMAREAFRTGKPSEAKQAMLEALAAARAEGDQAEEAEILAGLALLSSRRLGGRGERESFFQQAEKRAASLTTDAGRVIYLRARAAVLEDRGDFTGAEGAYEDALRICLTQPDDDKRNLATQVSIVRSSLVHFLCQQKRLPEAYTHLKSCEDDARLRPDEEDGELLQAALEAGIHYSLEAADEEGAVARIDELTLLATSAERANRIAGDLLNVANQSSHRKAHKAASAAAQAAVKLGQRYESLREAFLRGALYTEAMVIAQAGDDDRALGKAHIVLDLCTGPEDDAIRQAARQLIAEIHRTRGDTQTAVEMAFDALRFADGNLDNLIFSKAALARALNDNGQTEEALKNAKQAAGLAATADIPEVHLAELFAQTANYASQIGSTADVSFALSALDQLEASSEEIQSIKRSAKARSFANLTLRSRLSSVLEEQDPATTAGTLGCASLQEANSKVVRPLLRLWDDGFDATVGLYDFWGRGNFQRMLLNARCFPNTFNITQEVRSLDDIKRALRLWGLYADFLILLWKGAPANGLAVVPFPGDYEEPGGWGYLVAAGDVIEKKGTKRKWHPALAHISAFPEAVGAFLAGEARQFIASGRLVVVPAVAAGCVNPGHGPAEQLLAEVANAVPSIRCRGLEGALIGAIPFSPDAPLPLLAELAEAEAGHLRKLRLLLLKRSQQLRPDQRVSQEARLLALEIEDALRDLEDRNESFTRKRGLVKAKEPILGTTALFKTTGRSLASSEDTSPFAPLLVLKSMGYGWRVEGTEIPRFAQRFEPQEGDVVGTWLAPPSPGWSRPTVHLPTDLG